MIVVYPMIVSNAVSENTLPALAKMLEMYIAVYMQSDFMATANGEFGGPKPSMRYKIKKGKIIGEAIELNEADEESVLPGTKKSQEDYEMAVRAREELEKKREEYEKVRNDLEVKLRDLHNQKERAKTQQDKNKIDRQKFSYQRQMDRVKTRQDALDREYKQAEDAQKLAFQKSRDKRDQAKHDKEMKTKARKVDVAVSDRTISIEPTTVKVHTDKWGTQMIGIKVVPYRVISDAKLSHLLMHDIKVKGITALTIPLGRRIMGKLLRFTQRGPVSGDPKKDIIYRTTGHKGETFVVLEKNHDVDEYFLKNTKKINRLFKFGWGNFVIADDALGIAYFCMRASKGICQGVSYRMMYKTLGQSGVYEDLEDLRKQNSSLFKMRKKRFSKLLGESKADEKLINYQERQ